MGVPGLNGGRKQKCVKKNHKSAVTTKQLPRIGLIIYQEIENKIVIKCWDIDGNHKAILGPC